MKYSLFSSKHFRIFNYFKSKELIIGFNVCYDGTLKKKLRINLDLGLVGIYIEF